MRKEIRKNNSYTEINIFNSWPTMLLGLELRRDNQRDGFVVYTFGLTLFYIVLFFIEYTKWNDKII